MAIDIGAHVGNYALALAKRVGRTGLVLAIEAQPQLHERLVNSTAGARVIALHLAASNHAGWATLHVPRSSDGFLHDQLGSLEDRPDSSADFDEIEVRTIRVDDLVSKSRRVSVIKIDVEGHEQQVLEGLVEILRRDAPALVVELEQRHLIADRSIGDVVAWLERFGYGCQAITRNGLEDFADFDLARDQTAWIQSNGDIRSTPLDGNGYVNNFLFTHRPSSPELN